ncbi:MAG: ATP-binding protein [Chloroflexi bacterium]|nr:ATP-binding protein [Chloroflexota bacterium]
MDLNEKLRNADKMLLDGYTGQAVVAAGQVLETILQHLYQTTLPKLKASEAQTVSQKMEQIGKGKAVAEFTLGQLVRLFRETDFYDKCEAALGKKLSRLRAADYTTLIDLRNNAAHATGGEIEEDEARMIVSQARVFAREAGLLEQPKEEKKIRDAATILRPWSQVVKLHPDVASGQTATATYAIDLGALVLGDKNVPAVYREAEAFFRTTYPTSNMVSLIKEVLERLAGGSGDRVLQLRSPFGGGKSHVLAALFHATQNRPMMEKVWSEAKSWAKTESVRVAVFDGDKFDVQGREVASGIRVQTLWGWIAWSLGKQKLYERVRYHDEKRIAPGGDVIKELLGRNESSQPPTLIMLDEVLKYFERAQADRQVVGESTLGRQTLDFIQSLSTEVANSTNAVMIYSLQASAGEAFGNVALLNMLDHITSRVDSKREPVVGDEILPVLQRRLLSGSAGSSVVDQVADLYSGVVTNMRAAQERAPAEKRRIQDDAANLRRRFQAAYPFHPALIDLMKERWASIPDFQRTRGALRFLSSCLFALKDGSSALLGPGDVLIESGTVQHAFFTEVGQREQFKAVLEADFVGPNARARQIDEQMAAEFAHLSGVRPATRLATAILMYSFGGLQRQGESQGQTMASGVTEPDLLAAIVGPELDSLTAQTALKSLREKCLFLHYDGVRYVFKTTPNVTQLLEQEFNTINQADVENKIESDLQNRLASRPVFVWPKDSTRIDDRDPRFTLVYLPLEFASWGEARQKTYALDLLLRRGDQPRRYRNALGLAIPNWHQVETLRRAARYVLAVGRLRDKRIQVNLTTEQMAQLKEREETEKGKIESAFRELYNAVWLTVRTESETDGSDLENKFDLEKIDVGARPLGAANVHERLMELLTNVQRKVYSTLTPQKLIEYMRIGEYAAEVEGRPLGIRLDQVRDAFYENLGFPRLIDENVIRRAIAQGVKEGYFGYVGRADRIQSDRVREGSSYLLPRTQAIFERDLPTDEIDMGTGFIVLPTAIETSAENVLTSAASGAATLDTSASTTFESAITTPQTSTSPTSSSQTRVELRMRLDRAQLYASFNALANLADKAGTIQVNVVAESLQGFDSVWLRNAVKEPLDEAGVKVES